MKSLSLKLTDPLVARVAALARKRKTSKAAIIREALEAYFSPLGEGATLSCFDLASDLAGSLEGPGDLSVNKEYMCDFGK